MDLPNFRYLQDVQRFVDNINREIDDTITRVKKQQQVMAHVNNRWKDRVDAVVATLMPRITASNLVQASVVGAENFKIMAALERFVITQKGQKGAKNPGVDVDLDKVVVPNIKKLKSQYALADDLHRQYLTLQSVETQVAMQFADSRDLDKILKGVREARAKVESAMRETFVFLSDVANKHVPRSFQQYVDAIGVELAEHVVFRDSRSFMYVNVSNAGALIFTAYILLEDALNEEGELAPALYISLQWSQGADSEKPYLKVWLDHEFEMPDVLAGRPDGIHVSNLTSASKAVGRLLDLENFSSSIGVVPLSLKLKVDPTAISKRDFSYRDYVQSVVADTDNNVLRFVLSRAKGVDKNSVQKIGIALYPEVKRMLQGSRSTKLRMKTPYRKDDNWHIDFVVTELAKGNAVTLDDLDFLKTRFGLNDRQLRRVSDVFSSGD